MAHCRRKHVEGKGNTVYAVLLNKKNTFYDCHGLSLKLLLKSLYFFLVKKSDLKKLAEPGKYAGRDCNVNAWHAQKVRIKKMNGPEIAGL